MPEAGQKRNVKFRILTLNLDRVPPPSAKKQRVGWFKLEPTEQIQARWWLRRREARFSAGKERRTDPSWPQIPFLPGAPGHQSQTLDVLSSVFIGCPAEQTLGEHGNGIK